ncbi:Hypothetical predicted protein, partial [Paramuricea clavata]
MDTDLLECKKKAMEFLKSENPPCYVNGRKKGYIQVMKDLWDKKGYEHLGLKSQNLRDQAARLEKINATAETRAIGKVNSNLDLHTDNDIVQNSHERQETEAVKGFEVTNDCPGEPHAGSRIHEAGRLPNYVAVDIPSITIWGRRADGSIIAVNSSTIINAYDEITRWRKNTFLVPYGKLTQHINDWNNASQTQHIALKAAIVLLATALQKPSVKSKAKDHKECLEKRLALWKEGEVESLLREGRSIQKRVAKAKRTEPPNKAKIFAKLVMEGQINSALRYLSEADCDVVLPLTDNVMRQLQEKHPKAQEAKLGSLLFGPFEEVHGPSGADANGLKRIFACKSFKKSGVNFCEAVATMTRRICTEYIDPSTIEPILANRLIPLDKGEGAVRPIGVGEVIRRIVGKCVMKVIKPDVIDASGSLQ